VYGINIQVNGKQVEDLWQEWNARGREVEKLKRDNERLRAQLKECGEIIRTLKEEKEDLIHKFVLSFGEG
jgi:prefoldin subunit 5